MIWRCLEGKDPSSVGTRLTGYVRRPKARWSSTGQCRRLNAIDTHITPARPVRAGVALTAQGNTLVGTTGKAA